MDHAVDIPVEADEQTEFGLVLDLALDLRAGRILRGEGFPRIDERLLEAKRDAALDRIDFENLNLDLLARRDDLARMHVLFGPGHFRHMDQALDPRFELDEGTIVGDVRHPAPEPRAGRIFRLDALPGVLEQLLHAERDTVGFVINLDDFYPHRLADRQNLGRMIDSPPGDIGHVEEPVDAAKIDEGAVIGDVLHHAVDHLTFREVGDDLIALLGAGFLEHGAAGDDDIAPAAVHFQDLEGLRCLHQRRYVADRADIDLAARQERHGTVEIDGEAALDLVEDDAFDFFLLLESLFELDPAFLAPRLVARNDRLAERVLNPLKINLDLVADGELAFAPRPLKFLEGNPAFGLQTEIDDRDVFFDRDDKPLDDGAFKCLVLAVALVEKRREILARRRVGVCGYHSFS